MGIISSCFFGDGMQDIEKICKEGGHMSLCKDILAKKTEAVSCSDLFVLTRCLGMGGLTGKDVKKLADKVSSCMAYHFDKGDFKEFIKNDEGLWYGRESFINNVFFDNGSDFVKSRMFLLEVSQGFYGGCFSCKGVGPHYLLSDNGKEICKPFFQKAILSDKINGIYALDMFSVYDLKDSKLGKIVDDLNEKALNSIDSVRRDTGFVFPKALELRILTHKLKKADAPEKAGVLLEQSEVLLNSDEMIGNQTLFDFMRVLESVKGRFKESVTPENEKWFKSIESTVKKRLRSVGDVLEVRQKKQIDKFGKDIGKTEGKSKETVREQVEHMKHMMLRGR